MSEPDVTAPVLAEEEAEGKHPLESLIPELIIADRCDRCRAQAFVAVLLTADNEEPLRFCGHHFAKYESKILALDPFAVRDDRHKINLTVDSSA
jgi:hypothetical protein